MQGKASPDKLKVGGAIVWQGGMDYGEYGGSKDD